MVDTYIIKNAKLVFITDDNAIHEESLDIYVGIHELSFKPDEKAYEWIMVIPSVLGRDIIEKFRFVYDKNNDEVCLER